MNLVTYLGKQILGVLACYQQDDIVIHICGVYPQWDNRLRVFFPRGHALQVGELVTLHLDNRSGVDEFDSGIRVYRASYKASHYTQVASHRKMQAFLTDERHHELGS